MASDAGDNQDFRKSTRIRVEVVCAIPGEQTMITVEITDGATVGQAIEQSEILARFPTLELEKAQVGIFGRLVGLAHPLHDGDRIELYRPLITDPKQARHQRARRRRSQG
jgi:uncharacterized protein